MQFASAIYIRPGLVVDPVDKRRGDEKEYEKIYEEDDYVRYNGHGGCVCGG